MRNAMLIGICAALCAAGCINENNYGQVQAGLTAEREAPNNDNTDTPEKFTNRHHIPIGDSSTYLFWTQISVIN